MSRAGEKVYRIADIEVDAVQGCVRRQGTELHLRHKTFQVLLFLLEQRHRLVTKEELWESIWQGTAVTDDALTRCVMDIRKALGDDARQQRFLKTVSKAGYRFVGPVEEECPQPVLAVIETEITTFEVEVEEISRPGQSSVSERSLRQYAPARALPPAPSRFRYRRIVLGVALAMIAILAGGYFGYRFSRSTPPPPLELTLAPTTGKKSVAVMYLNNQSNTPELDWLREGLADMLISNLSRSKKLAVLNRQQLHLVLERTGYKPGDKITLQKALEVAGQSRAEAIVLGSFAKLDESVRVDLQLYDGHNGELLSTESLVVDKHAQILAQVDLLSLKIANQLGASETETPGNIAQTMTNSLEAYRYYSMALEKAQGFDNTAAVELLKKAIALDSEFAMAYARIGYAYVITGGQAEKAKPYFEKAFRLANRLSDKDKLHLTAWYAITNLDWVEAIRTTREITANYPLEGEAYLQLGRLLQGEARYDEAIEVLQRGLAIDPQAKDLHNTLGLVYSEQGNHDQAIAAHERYLALAPALPNAHDSLGMSYQWAGRYDEAVNEYNRAIALNPDFEVARVHLANTYYQQGRYQAAAEQFKRYIEIAPSDDERGRGYDSLALIYSRRKDYRKAAQAAQKASRYSRLTILQQIMVLTDLGSLTKAEVMNQQLLEQQTNTNRGRRWNLKWHHFFRGYIALKRSQSDAAIENFKEATRHPTLSWTADPLEDCLANAYLELRRFDEAVTEYERILKLNPNYPLAHYHLAQAYDHQGQVERARTEYKEFLQVWSNADPDIPEIILARARLNLLKSSQTSALKE